MNASQYVRLIVIWLTGFAKIKSRCLQFWTIVRFVYLENYINSLHHLGSKEKLCQNKVSQCNGMVADKVTFTSEN